MKVERRKAELRRESKSACGMRFTHHIENSDNTDDVGSVEPEVNLKVWGSKTVGEFGVFLEQRLKAVS